MTEIQVVEMINLTFILNIVALVSLTGATILSIRAKKRYEAAIYKLCLTEKKIHQTTNKVTDTANKIEAVLPNNGLGNDSIRWGDSK